MNGVTSINDRRPIVQKLTKVEEEMIVQHVFDRDSRGFSPWLADIEDMANYLLEAHGAKCVGKCWVQRFVARQPELKTCFNRVYDFQRALCKDPKVLGAWFRLVENIRAKYSILDYNFYNFNKTGFIISIICLVIVVIYTDRYSRGKVV